MKKCPYCAEEIQDEAILCHYCGSELEGYKKVSKKENKRNEFIKKRANVWSALLVSLFFAIISTFLPERYFLGPLILASIFLGTFLSYGIIMLILVIVFPNYFYRIVAYGYFAFALIILIIGEIGFSFPAQGIFEKATSTPEPTKIPQPTKTPYSRAHIDKGFLEWKRYMSSPYQERICRPTSLFNFNENMRTACIVGYVSDVDDSKRQITIDDDFILQLPEDVIMSYRHTYNGKCVVLEFYYYGVVENSYKIHVYNMSLCTPEAQMFLDYSENNNFD